MAAKRKSPSVDRDDSLGKTGIEPGEGDEKRFVETLKRMLKMPPRPHDKERKKEVLPKKGATLSKTR